MVDSFSAVESSEALSLAERSAQLKREVLVVGFAVPNLSQFQFDCGLAGEEHSELCAVSSVGNVAFKGDANSNEKLVSLVADGVGVLGLTATKRLQSWQLAP